MTAPNVTVRPATREDMPVVMQMIRDWLRLIPNMILVTTAICLYFQSLQSLSATQDLATYEQVPDGPKISSEDLIRDGFDTSPAWLFALVAETASPAPRLVGHALCHRAYSSWLGRAMYVEDLYVDPQLRGQRIGHRLFKEICKVGGGTCEENMQQLNWHGLLNNAPAIRFYEQHGAYDLCWAESRTAYRMMRERKQAVADSAE